MGPREYLYDTENLESIAVYKGAVPADLGTGVGARGGAVELRPRWPGEDFGAFFGQAFGENDYSRTFLRIDSGKLPRIDTALALSYSYADADKWKGPGSMGPRNNVGVMLSQPVPFGDDIHFWFNYNDLSQDLYPAPRLRRGPPSGNNTTKRDYNSSLTGVKGEDIYYYKYNRGDYLNRDYLAEIPVDFSEMFRLTIKPYYSDEDTEILVGATSQGGMITKRERDIERYGIITQFDSRLVVGHRLPGILVRIVGHDHPHAELRPGDLRFPRIRHVHGQRGRRHRPQPPSSSCPAAPAISTGQAGLKYFYYKDPASQGYTSPAPDYTLVKAPDLYREENEYDEFLPTLGVAWRMDESVEWYASYGRNQIRPYAYMPLINIYNQNRAKFQAAGVTLNDLFSGYEMEISDNVELGLRYRGERFEIMPALFYSKHQDLLTTVYDPRVGLSYYQNVGDATGYGIDLETNFFVTDNLTFFFNTLLHDPDLRRRPDLSGQHDEYRWQPGGGHGPNGPARPASFSATRGFRGRPHGPVSRQALRRRRKRGAHRRLHRGRPEDGVTPSATCPSARPSSCRSN